LFLEERKPHHSGTLFDECQSLKTIRHGHTDLVRHARSECVVVTRRARGIVAWRGSPCSRLDHVTAGQSSRALGLF
jgi:hypothetical protein